MEEGHPVRPCQMALVTTGVLLASALQIGRRLKKDDSAEKEVMYKTWGKPDSLIITQSNNFDNDSPGEKEHVLDFFGSLSKNCRSV